MVDLNDNLVILLHLEIWTLNDIKKTWFPFHFFHTEFALFHSSFSSFLETNWRIFQRMHFPIIVYHYLQQRERTLHAMQLWCNFSRQQKVPKNLTIFLSKNWQINLFLIFLWYCSPSSATSVSEMLTRQLLYLRTLEREMYIQYIPHKIKEYIQNTKNQWQLSL